ncbi:hypothetical protein [Bacillus cereus]|uniref:hypothetical protein n=1 Tax=Bacillus cereus TaxID=1396 RepID=UPI00234BE31A|nr:hypothetical protein [Bacillus cereus]
MANGPFIDAAARIEAAIAAILEFSVTTEDPSFIERITKLAIKKEIVLELLLEEIGLSDNCVRTQLVTNGGFETGTFAGWVVSGSASVLSFTGGTFPRVNPNEGEFLAQLAPGASISQTIPSGICPDRVYRLNVALSSPGPNIDSPNNSRTVVSVQFFDSMGVPISIPENFIAERITQDTNSEGGWNYHRLLTGKTPAGAAQARITIATDNSDAGIRVDNVSLILEN